MTAPTHNHELYLLDLGQLGVRDSRTGKPIFNQLPGYVIRTASRRVILAIDAISVAEQLTMASFPSIYPDQEAARQSRDKLLALSEETGALIVMGHDAEQWATLPKSPAPFRRPEASGPGRLAPPRPELS